MGIRQRAFEPARFNFCVWLRGRGKWLSGAPPSNVPAPLRCKFSVFALALLNLHLICSLTIRIHILFTCKKQAARFINIHLLRDEVV